MAFTDQLSTLKRVERTTTVHTSPVPLSSLWPSPRGISLSTTMNLLSEKPAFTPHSKNKDKDTYMGLSCCMRLSNTQNLENLVLKDSKLHHQCHCARLTSCWWQPASAFFHLKVRKVFWGQTLCSEGTDWAQCTASGFMTACESSPGSVLSGVFWRKEGQEGTPAFS